jgi:Domain of unknown function (DUF6745)
MVNARISIYEDISGVFGQVTQDELETAESGLWKGSRGALMSELHCPATSSLVGLSAVNEYSFSMIADDQAQLGDRQPPAILEAAWRVSRSAGLWWPFSGVAVMSDRPSERRVNDARLLHRGDGPAAIYRDGWKVFAWEGMAAAGAMNPEPRDDPAERTGST